MECALINVYLQNVGLIITVKKVNVSEMILQNVLMIMSVKVDSCALEEYVQTNAQLLHALLEVLVKKVNVKFNSPLAAKIKIVKKATIVNMENVMIFVH